MGANKLELIPKLIEPWFFFALVWSIGATCDGNSRKKFSSYIRETMKEENVSVEIEISIILAQHCY